MAFTFRKASSAMLVASVATAVSFFATCFSPIMPICSFGIFSGIVIIVNFLLILIVLPNVYLCYEMHIKSRFTCFKKGVKYLRIKLDEIKMKKKPEEAKPRKKSKYDDLSEVQIPMNVDLNDDVIDSN
jgi:predicted RND superfamily exporter protein